MSYQAVPQGNGRYVRSRTAFSSLTVGSHLCSPASLTATESVRPSPQRSDLTGP